VERAHIAQVKYYLYKLLQKGVEGATGIIEYPKLKQREEVASLSPADVEKIREWEEEVQVIVNSPVCPDVIHAKICRQCSYCDFCYSSEPA
jgi:CRISPR-associated exonuclease Cas4